MTIMEFLSIQQRLLPDLMETLKKRHTILRYIMLMQPVGRRKLAQMLQITERVLRAEVEFLREQDLIKTETNGMQLTASGYTLLEKLEPMVKQLFGLTEMEEELAQKLGIKKAVIVSGDADQDELSKKEIGRMGARLIQQLVQPRDVVAVTGGSTVAEVAEMLPSSPLFQDVLFVPARGGLGENMDYQANTLVSLMANKTGGQYRLLHVPDRLSQEAYQSLIRDDVVKEILQKIASARVVLHGIGEAIAMSNRRKLDEAIIDQLQRQQAVGEAFGYYFNPAGEIVYRMRTIGIDLDHIQKAEVVIAVAGGKSKAKAIAAVTKNQFPHILITDETAAQEILNL